jgi:hypothetical protein
MFGETGEKHEKHMRVRETGEKHEKHMRVRF